MEELQLTGVETGFILIYYYWGYITGQLAAVLLPINSQFALGQHHVLAWCVLTALTAHAHRHSIRTRAGLFAVAEGRVAILSITRKSMDAAHERGGRMACAACGYLGIISGMLLVGWLSVFGLASDCFTALARSRCSGSASFGSWSMTTRDNIRG